MVDKVDKPEAPRPYTVQSPSESKRDKPKEERGQEDLPTFKQGGRSLYEEKFGGAPKTIKTIRVPLRRIAKLLFKKALPFHGTPTAFADLLWNDGRITENVHFLLKNWSDFLKIKNAKIGESIPQEYWSSPKGYLDCTIGIQGHSSGSWELSEPQKGKSPPQAAAPQKPPVRLIAAVVFGALAILLALFLFWIGVG